MLAKGKLFMHFHNFKTLLGKKRLENVIHILFWWQLMRILLWWICDMPLVNRIMLTIHMLIHIAIKWINIGKESAYHRSCPHHDQQKEYATFILGESGSHNCLLDELALLWEEVISITFATFLESLHTCMSKLIRHERLSPSTKLCCLLDNIEVCL